ncbi:hypothetical protein GCM10020001_039420 [Nonomuraea salmonea]
MSACVVLVYATSDTPADAAASITRRWLATRSPTGTEAEISSSLSAPRECLGQAVRVREVGAAYRDASVGQILDPGDVPAGRDDVRGRDPAPQQCLDGEPAQLAGGSSDDDRHDGHSFLPRVPRTPAAVRPPRDGTQNDLDTLYWGVATSW